MCLHCFIQLSQEPLPLLAAEDVTRLTDFLFDLREDFLLANKYGYSNDTVKWFMEAILKFSIWWIKKTNPSYK